MEQVYYTTVVIFKVTIKQEVLSDEEMEQVQTPMDCGTNDGSDDIIFVKSMKHSDLSVVDIICREGELLNLSKTQCDDLSILLLGPRQSTLSWSMDKKEFLEACLDFMKNFGTQYEEKELTYLKVDYSKFDNLPRPEIDEYCGIEKGYEIFLEEEEQEEPPLPSKHRKKTYESEGNDSAEFDYLYSSSDDSESSSSNKTKQKRKKKRYQHSSSDSDFKPSSKKSYKDKKLTKKIPKKSRQDYENSEYEKLGFNTVGKVSTKPKPVKDLSVSYIIPKQRVSSKMKPCMRPTLIVKPKAKGKKHSSVEIPEKKISLLRLIRKVKIHNDVTNTDSLIPPEISQKFDKCLKTVHTLGPESYSQDKTTEITSQQYTERDKFLDFCVMKNSYSSSTGSNTDQNHQFKEVPLSHLVSNRNIFFSPLTKPTPQVLGKSKSVDQFKGEPFAEKINVFTQSYFSNEISQYFKANPSSSNSESKPKSEDLPSSNSSIPLDIPGLSGPDMFDWIKPPVVTQTVNVLDVLCHKLDQKSTNNTAINSLTTTSITNSNTNENSINYLEYENSNHHVSMNKTDSNIVASFNLDIFQSGKHNIDMCPIAHNKHNNHTHDSNKNSYTPKNNFHNHGNQPLKKEDKSTDPFVSESEIPLLESREKSIMNLTNFYNDAKNQIDDNSESESSLYDVNENSQYESVTVLKTEPIIDNSVLDTGNSNLINNLDDAVFIFQNNLDVPDTVSNSLPAKDNNSESFIKKTRDEISHLNILKTDQAQSDNLMERSSVKVINFKPTLLPPSKSNVNPKFNTKDKSISSPEKTNFCSPNIITSNLNDPVPSTHTKVINNAINFKYISFPEKSDTNKILINNKNVKFPIFHMQLPESSLPTLKMNDLKRDKPPGEEKLNENTNVKYLVKDKNIFKLLYVNPPSTDGSSNVQVLNIQQTKSDKPNESSTSPFKKKITTPTKSPHLNIPKLLHFDSQRNCSPPVNVSKVVMKINDKKPGLNHHQDISNPLKQSVNIIYQPTKNPTVVGPKNLIVTFPQTKINSKSTDVLTKSEPLPAEKPDDKKFNINPVCTHKIVLVPAISESTKTQTPPVPERTNPISSTTMMEQVREFESVLEKVKQTSQLKEKVPNDEIINTSFIATDQKTIKNLTAVTLGNILLQPTKIATHTNLIYTLDKKVATVDNKPFNVKQTPIIIAKPENKAVKQTSTNTHFPPPRPSIATSNASSSTTTNSTIKPIQKAQEDEQTAEKIYKILNSYTEKIKNAPELKNKPAPRRRSNPPITNSAKCRKSVKCPSKFTFDQNSNADLSNDSTDKETTTVTGTTTVFPISVAKVKDNIIKPPVQIKQLTMPICSTQDNQVVLLTNDKHIILKKIKHVQKICPTSPIVKPMLKADSIVGNTQVVHYKIRNDSMQGINLINYVPSVDVSNRASIITTTMPPPPPIPINSISSNITPYKVNKFAQETQTDISMECSPVTTTKTCETQVIKEVPVVKVEPEEMKLDREFEIKDLCVDVDKHYFKNVDILFSTSLIFLNYPSSQLFMFEATYALSRMMRTNAVSSTLGKQYTSRQMNELQTFAESRLPLWEKMKIIDDIILKKKGPHICDTMMIMIKKNENKKPKDNTLKTTHEDKIEVNKCNKNPKCYGKKNGINENSKFTKFPQPLEPTVIITNRPDNENDFDMLDDSNNYRKPTKNDRKRHYQESSSINFDEIEVDNPKVAMPKKKRKCGNTVSTSSTKSDNSKRNLSTTLSDKTNNKVNEKEKRSGRVLRTIKTKSFKASIRNKKVKHSNKKIMLRNTLSVINSKSGSNQFFGNLRNKAQVNDNLKLKKVDVSSREVRVRKENDKQRVNKLGDLNNVKNEIKSKRIRESINYSGKTSKLDLKVISSENKVTTRQAAGSHIHKNNDLQPIPNARFIRARRRNLNHTLKTDYPVSPESKPTTKPIGKNVSYLPDLTVTHKVAKSKILELDNMTNSKKGGPDFVDINGSFENSVNSCGGQDKIVELSATINSQTYNREMRGLLKFNNDEDNQISNSNDCSKKILNKKS
uniref:Uncharacterized protein n=3 Tax=Cacopsylla melanoneura TaxID=428564 RepID=A0A8D8VIS2_9HEMI